MNRNKLLAFIDDSILDGGERAHLLTANNKLILNAADMLRDIFMKDLKKVCYLDQPVMTNIRQEKVTRMGHIITGSVDWQCEMVSPMFGRRAKIVIEMPIVEGYLLKPLTFKTSVGLRYSLNESGIKNAMRLPDKIRRTFYAPEVNRALINEK